MSPERRSRTAGAKPAPVVEAEPVAVEAAAPVALAEPIPFDRTSDPDAAALTTLSADLAGAGRRARSRKAQATIARPDLAFVDILRARLLAPGGAFTSGAFAGAGFGGASFGTAALAGAGIGTTLEAPARSRPAVRAARPRSTRALRAWAVFAVTVVLLVAATGMLARQLVAIPANRAGDVAGATLIRDGAPSALLAGAALSSGDEIQVGSTGHATLLLGSSQARLAAGADVQLSSLSGSAPRLALVTGRVYSRVSLPAGGSYAVDTGPYSWIATGTAFDLTSSTLAGGGTQVVLLALEHSVTVTGPSGSQMIQEGSAVTAIFGSPATDGITVGPIPASDFADPWLIANAKTDESLGDPIGALAGVALAPNGTPTTSGSSPSDGPTAPTATPGGTPGDTPGSSPGLSPSPTPGSSATPAPTDRPTPSPSASPSPSPTPTATPALGLSLTSCPGGVLLNWSKYTGSGFVRYATLRSPNDPSIPAEYNAALVLSGASTTSSGTTSAADPGNNQGGTYFYRTLALGTGNKVLQASSVEASSGSLQADLGPASVSGPVISWNFFGVPTFSPPDSSLAACFSDYKVLYSGYASGSITVSSRLETNIPVPDASGFGSGDTISFRVQVIRTTPLGQFVVAETTGTQPFYRYP